MGCGHALEKQESAVVSNFFAPGVIPSLIGNTGFFTLCGGLAVRLMLKHGAIPRAAQRFFVSTALAAQSLHPPQCR